MEYNKHDVVKDFARRTRKNLDLLQSLPQKHPDMKTYEVTQLINSMLGLLVFPQQRYVASIPKTPLCKLAQQGWPIPKVVDGYPPANNLNQLIRYLRNAIAHFNIEFLSDQNLQIRGLRVWNVRQRKSQHETTWKAELTIEDIEKITNKFVQLLLEEPAELV